TETGIMRWYISSQTEASFLMGEPDAGNQLSCTENKMIKSRETQKFGNEIDAKEKIPIAESSSPFGFLAAIVPNTIARGIEMANVNPKSFAVWSIAGNRTSRTGRK